MPFQILPNPYDNAPLEVPQAIVQTPRLSNYKPSNPGEVEAPNWSKIRRDIPTNGYSQRKTLVIPISGELFIVIQPESSGNGNLSFLSEGNVNIFTTISESDLVEQDLSLFLAGGPNRTVASWAGPQPVSNEVIELAPSISAIYVTGAAGTQVAYHMGA